MEHLPPAAPAGTGSIRPLVNPPGQTAQPPAVPVTAASQALSPAPVACVSSPHGRTIDTMPTRPRSGAPSGSARRAAAAMARLPERGKVAPPFTLPHPAPDATGNGQSARDAQEAAAVGHYLDTAVTGFEKIAQSLEKTGASMTQLVDSAARLQRSTEEAVEGAQRILDGQQRILENGKEILENGKEILENGKEILENGKKILENGKKMVENGKKMVEGLKRSVKIMNNTNASLDKYNDWAERLLKDL